jgi:hypothetical protein
MALSDGMWDFGSWNVLNSNDGQKNEIVFLNLENAFFIFGSEII